MRLAFLADASLPHTVRWVNEFVARGHDCLLASLEAGDGYGCPVVSLPPRPWLPRFARYTLAVPRAGALLRDFRPEVVNAHFLPNYGWMAARAGARPLVLTALGSDILTVPQRSPLHRWRTRWVLSRCAAVTSDAAMLSAAIGAFGVPAARILTVPFGIEADRFAGAAVRPESPIVILSTRRLEPVYDVETLLAAWERLSAGERSRFELRIAGSGSQQAALHARGAGLETRFLGWLSMTRLDAELRRAHLYVSTSRSDSTSVSLLEAMGAGCLPIVSDLPANREWIDDGDNGLIFPPGDAGALAERLRRAASDADLRRRAARRNRELVAARADWHSNLSEVEGLFARLAGRAPAADPAPSRPGG
jgi:glycosyltransferase involved in cell wall biosynthesis